MTSFEIVSPLLFLFLFFSSFPSPPSSPSPPFFPTETKDLETNARRTGRESSSSSHSRWVFLFHALYFV